MINFNNTITLNRVFDILQECIIEVKPEIIPIHQAVNRVTSCDIHSKIDYPPYNRTNIDGYAVKSSDTTGASENNPAYLKLKGNISIGKKHDFELEHGCAYSIPTGGMLPNGSDGVIMLEYTEIFDEQVAVYKPVSKGTGIVYKGEDIKRNQLLIEKNHIITTNDLPLLSAGGIFNINVYKKLRVALFSTGNEITSDENDMINQSLIPDINGVSLHAKINNDFCDVITHKIIIDDKAVIKSAFEKVVDDVDIIIVSGATSVGPHDYIREVIESFDDSNILYHGVRIKPGKPSMTAIINKTMLFSLPGHPLSCMMIYNAIVKPYLYNTSHISPAKLKGRIVNASLAESIRGEAGRTVFVPVKITKDKDGQLATPLKYKSGMIKALTEADGYIMIPEEKEGLEKNRVIEVFAF